MFVKTQVTSDSSHGQTIDVYAEGFKFKKNLSIHAPTRADTFQTSLVFGF